jgi:hypothetical protein
MARYLRTMVAALAATTATAGEAAAQWTPPFPVSAPAGIAEEPKAAVDASGTAVVVWAGDDTVHARRIDPAGGSGPILTIGAGRSAEVAVDGTGNATVVWTGDDTVAQARRITASGALEDAKTVSAPGDTAFTPVVGVDADGDATVVWTRYDNPHFRVQARTLDASGALGPIQDITPDSLANFDYDLAVDPAGNAFVVWPWKAGAVTVVQGRWLGGAIEDLSDSAQNAFDPHVAIAPSGVATAVWYRDDGTIQARRATPGGPLQSIVDLSGVESVSPDVAVAPSGDATVVWERFDGVTDRIELRRYAADGSLEPVRDLWTGGDDIRARVAVDGAGNATAVWHHIDGGDIYVRTRTAAPGGVLGTSLDLSVADEVAEAEIATDASGRAIAVWARVDGSDTVLEAARFVVPAAEPPVAPAPAAVTACPTVTLEKLRSDRPRTRRRRAKGVGAELTTDRAARLRIVSAKLRYRGRTAKLSTRLNGLKLRLKLPGRHARRLAVGTRVRLVLKVRARPAAAGCGFGAARTFRIRTRVVFV